MSGHTVEELREFFDADLDSRNVWARDLSLAQHDAAAVVFMPEGHADRLRADTRAGRYVCVLPGCPTPLLRTVGGDTGRRHHWRHVTAPNPRHEPETVWHQQAKAALTTFVRDAHPRATVCVDDRITASGARPDVWARTPWTAGADGTTPGWSVAFEVQYSALDVRELQNRSDRYVADMIVPVWLFAHLDRLELSRPTGAPTGPDDAATVRTLARHRAAAALGPLRWLNPTVPAVATAYVSMRVRPDQRPGEAWADVTGEVTMIRHPHGTDRDVHVRVDPLDRCWLDATGLHTPADDWIKMRARDARAEEERLRALARTAFERMEEIRIRAAGRARAATADSGVPIQPVQKDAESLFDMPGRQPPHARRWMPPVRPARPPRDRLTDPCEVCGAAVEARTAWPSWFVPPKGVTVVGVCTDAACGTPFLLPPPG